MKEDKKYTIPKKYIDIALMAVVFLEIASLCYQSIQLYLGKNTEDSLFLIMFDALFLISITIYKIVRICRKAKKGKENQK